MYVQEGVVIGPLDTTYRGPYCVLVRERKMLLLLLHDSARTWVSVDHLKLHVGAKTPEAAQPPHVAALASRLDLNIFIRFFIE